MSSKISFFKYFAFSWMAILFCGCSSEYDKALEEAQARGEAEVMPAIIEWANIHRKLQSIDYSKVTAGANKEDMDTDGISHIYFCFANNEVHKRRPEWLNLGKGPLIEELANNPDGFLKDGPMPDRGGDWQGIAYRYNAKSHVYVNMATSALTDIDDYKHRLTSYVDDMRDMSKTHFPDKASISRILVVAITEATESEIGNPSQGDTKKWPHLLAIAAVVNINTMEVEDATILLAQPPKEGIWYNITTTTTKQDERLIGTTVGTDLDKRKFAMVMYSLQDQAVELLDSEHKYLQGSVLPYPMPLYAEFPAVNSRNWQPGHGQPVSIQYKEAKFMPEVYSRESTDNP